MQDQLRTLNGVVGPEPFVATPTPRREDAGRVVFEAPAPPPAGDAVAALEKIRQQLADAQAARTEEAASREKVVADLKAELEPFAERLKGLEEAAQNDKRPAPEAAAPGDGGD